MGRVRLAQRLITEGVDNAFSPQYVRPTLSATSALGKEVEGVDCSDIWGSQLPCVYLAQVAFVDVSHVHVRRDCACPLLLRITAFPKAPLWVREVKGVDCSAIWKLRTEGRREVEQVFGCSTIALLAAPLSVWSSSYRSISPLLVRRMSSESTASGRSLKVNIAAVFTDDAGPQQITVRPSLR
jgi:hypothetical protein